MHLQHAGDLHCGPDLLLDVVRGLRSCSFRPQALAGFGAGILILLYLKLFIVPQNALTKSNYWDANFMPHSGIANQIAFVWMACVGS